MLLLTVEDLTGAQLNCPGGWTVVVVGDADTIRAPLSLGLAPSPWSLPDSFVLHVAHGVFLGCACPSVVAADER